MPDLPEVTQEFTANVQPYIDELARAAAAAEEFAAKAKDAGAAAGVLGIDAQTAARMLDALENAETLLAGQSTLLNSILREVTDAESTMGRTANATAGMLDIMARAEAAAAEQAAKVAASAAAAGFNLEKMGRSAAGAAASVGAASAAMRSMGRGGDTGLFGPGIVNMMQKEKVEADALAVAIAKAGGAANNSNQMFRIWGTGIRLTGNALHWLVMGTGEILSTAIPAVVALTAAGAAMAPTFTHIADQMNYLRIATGSWTNVMANSVGPLAAVSNGMRALRDQVAPNAYIIFGAAINALTGHIGAFNQMTRQAANVLSQFATKLSAELSGPLGNQLLGFFRSAVTYMIQWGQVLGNLAHAFMNFFGDLAGVGHLLLDVLVQITHALVAITGNPIGQWVIRVVAGFSALYRYAQLLLVIFGFLNRALVAPFIGAIKWVVELVREIIVADAALAAMDAEVSTLDVTMTVLDGLLGPIGWAMLALGAIVGGVLVSGMLAGTNATDKLIASVQKAPQTINSLHNSFQVLSRAIQQLPAPVQQTTMAIARFGPVGATSLNMTTAASQKLVAQLVKTAQSTINLVTGMAQAGIRAGSLGQYMQVLAVQTALADSKIQALNQAIDQIVGIMLGGLSSVAQFATGLNQLGSVAATTGNALTRSGGQLTLTAGQFSHALSSMSATGAAAWTNLTSLIGGAMQQTADWFRTARSLGVATSAQVNNAILSMVGSISKYVGGNKNAQLAVLGWARANGIVTSSFGNLMSQVHNVHGGMGNLTKDVFSVSGAMANLSAMAKSAAAALNSEATAAIAAAALKASGFDGTVNKLNSDIAQFGPNSAQVHQDLQTMGAQFQTAQGYATTWGQQVNTAANNAAAGTHSGVGKMATDFAQNKLHMMTNEAEVGTLASKTATGMGKVASTTKSNLSTADSAMHTALSTAQTLQNFINGMHGTNITITTTFKTIGSPGGGPGGQVPYHGAVYGYAGGGIVGGMGGMDRIPAMLTAGEAVLTKSATQAMGGPLGIRNLNDNPHLFSQGGGGGSTGTINLTIISPVQIDGHTINSQTRTSTLIYNRRNPTNNLTLRNR